MSISKQTLKTQIQVTQLKYVKWKEISNTIALHESKQNNIEDAIISIIIRY